MTDETPRTPTTAPPQRYSLTIEPDDSAYLELDPDGHWCVADEAEDAIAEARAPLDVERLARALQRVIDNGDALALFREDAEAIAREYAREYAREEPTPPRKPAWVGVPDANGDIHCSRLAPQRCMWLEGHYGGCATP
jgi:hypothetical protein